MKELNSQPLENSTKCKIFLHLSPQFSILVPQKSPEDRSHSDVTGSHRSVHVAVVIRVQFPFDNANLLRIPRTVQEICHHAALAFHLDVAAAG